MAEWTSPASNSLIVIDKQIADWQSILDSVPAGSDVIFVESGGNGVEILKSELAGRVNLDAVHIFSHGQVGRVQLGTSWLDSDTLAADPSFATAFASALGEDGDIFLYGCDVALGVQGESFVRQLAHLTGADVAASVNSTGGAGLEADWELEHTTGEIDFQSFSIDEFSGTLALPADGLYTFAGATASGNVYVTKDGFFEIAGYDGNGQNNNVSADQYGAYIQEGTTTGGPYTSYIEVRVVGGGSFQVTTASILDYADGSGNHDFYDIYAVGLVDGSTVVTTSAVSSVGVLHDVKYPIDYTPFNGVFIDTFRVYYTWSSGTSQEDFNLESLTIKSASNEPPVTLNAPTLTVSSANPTFTEGGSAVDLFSSVSAATNDSGQNFSGMTLTVTNVTNGSAEVLNIGGTDVSLTNGNSGALTGIGSYSVSLASGTATVTLSGMTRSDAQLGELIDGITYKNTSDAPGTSNRVVTITGITDNGGSNNTATPNKASTITIAAVNDAPTATNLTQSLSQNLSTTLRALDDIVVLDADGTDTITATFTLSNKAAGTLSTGTFGSATSTYNSGTGVWTVTGSISDVNAALAAVAFTRDSAWSQSLSITTRIRDASATGPADGTITISQTDDMAPTVTSIVRQTPSTQYTNASELTWRVTFSEAVENVDKADFFVASQSTSGEIALSNVVSVGNNAYDITVTHAEYAAMWSGLTGANTDGVLNFAKNQNITDAEGNALSVTTPTGANETQYIVDNSAPTFSGPSSTPADNGLLTNLGSDLTLQFTDSKTVSEVASGIKSGKGLLTLRNLTTDEVVETFDVQSSGSLTFKDSTVTINPSKDLQSGSRYAVQIESGAITDLAGNTFAGISNNTDFNFETVPQVVLSVDNTSIKEAGGVATVTATLKDSAGNTVTAPDTVTIELTAETSTAGKYDFDLSSGTITISKGSSTGTITVTGVADEVSDNGETVVLGIYSVSKAVDVSEQTVSITLSENTAPVVDLNGAEGDGTSFSTSFTEDGGPVVVVKTDAGQEAFVSDSDGDTIQSMTVTLTNRPDGNSTESLALNSAATTAANGLTVNYTQNTGVLSISGAASASVYQSVLRGVTYNNTSQSPDITNRSINVVVNDGKADSSTAVATVSVARVNDAPVVDAKASPALSGVNEDLAAPLTTTDKNINQISGLLTGVSDVDTGAVKGIAVTAVNSAEGTLWFSTRLRTAWEKVENVSDSNALLLRSDDFLYWQPAADKYGTVNDALTFRAWDRTSGTNASYVDASNNGGTTAFSSATDTVSVTVTGVNDAPTLSTTTKALTAVNEDTNSAATQVSDLLTALGYADDDGNTGGVAITGAEGAGEWQYSTDGSSWFDVDTVNSSASLLLNADALIRYQPDGKNGETDAQLSLRAWDQTNGTASSGSTRGTIDSNSTGGTSAISTQLASITVAVSSVNDAPTIDNSATYTMNGIAENETSAGLTVSTILSDAHLADVDSGAVSGVAITATVGNGTWEYSADTGKTWSAISSVSDSSALLLASDAQLRYVGDSKRGETATFSYRAWDQTSGTAGSKADVSTHGGTTAFSSNSSKVSLAVSNINERPLLDTKASPALTTILEDSAAPQNGSTTGSTKVSSLLTGASDADGDTPGIAIAGANGGTVWYSLDAGTTWTAASGLSTTNVLLLESSHLVYFQPSTSKEGIIDNALTFLVWDTTGAEGAGNYRDPTADSSASSPYSANTDTVSVSITAVNDAPTLTADDKHVLTATTEDATSTATLVSAILTGVEYADVDANALSGMAITAVTGNGTWQFSADAGANWSNFPTVSASAALLLAADSQVRYVPDAQNSESASMSFRAWDQTTGAASTSGSAQTADTSTTGGSSAFSTQLASATLQVTAVNDAPVLDSKASPILSGISEDLAAPVTNNTTNSTLVSTLLGGVSDVDNSASKGIAIVATNTTEGTLWYYNSNALTWTAVTGAAENNALLLLGTDRVYWQPAANKNGTISDAFTFRAWDVSDKVKNLNYRDTTTNGGTSSFSTATDTVAVTVTAVNDAPTLTTTSKALSAVNEDAASKASKVSDLLTDLGYTDVDSDAGGVAITAAEGAGEWQYSTDGSNWFDVDTVSSSASLLLNADALVRYQPDGKNGETDVQLSLRAWDQSSGTATSGSNRATTDSNSTGGSHPFSTQQATITVEVGSLNDAPTIDSGATYTMTGITEDETSAAVTVSTILTDAKWADIDTGAVSGMAITAASGNGGWQYSTDTGKTWSAISSVSDSSALLLASDAQLRYVGDSKRGETPSLSYRAWDQTTGTAGSKADTSTHGGTTAFSDNSSSVSLTISNINDRPLLDTKASPTLTTVLEDAAAPQNGSTTGATTVSALLSGASDVDGDTLGMAISALSEGTLWFSLDTGKTWSAASGVSATNALLLNGDDLVYLQPTANKNGTVSTALTFHVWDTTGAEGAGNYRDPTADSSASSPYSANTDTVSVSITAVNDAPTLTADDKHVLTATTEDATSTATLVSAILTGVEYADVDANALSGMAITAVTGNGTWQFSADSGANWSNFPTVSSTAALLLAADSQVRYVPDAENSESASLSFRAWDQTSGTASVAGSIQTADTTTNGGASAFSAQSASATLQVSAVNDAPVLDTKASPALSGISEDLAAPASSSTSNSTLVSSLLSGVSDVDNSASQGLAVTAVNSTQGTLWFSIDAGSSWTSVDKASNSNALLLRATDRVYWQPAANKNGPVNDAFSFRAWDRTATGAEGEYVDTSTNGGTTAYSTATDTVAVTVTAVNDAPALTTTSKALTAVNEDTTTAGTKVSALLTDLGYSDIESDVGGVAITGAEGAGEWQYSTDGSNWSDVDTVSSSASLLLDDDALIRYQPDAKNGEANARLNLRAWDQTSGTASSGSTRGTIDSSSTGDSSAFSTQLASITVDVSSVNDAPTIDSGATYTMATITEDQTSSAVTVSSILSDAKWADVDSSALSGMAITAVNGNGSWEYSSDTGKTWSAISSVSDSSALLITSDAQLRYTGDSKRGETATLSYRAWDQTSGSAGSTVDVSTSGSTTAFSSNSSKASILLTNVNDNATGSVTIEGAAEVGNTLRISNSIADVDGLGTFSYVWKADGTVIDGATRDTFIIPSSLINKTITVTIEYTDQGGTKESMLSKATSTVVEVVAGTNIDGALVSETTETGSNGSTITVTEIGIVGEGRQEQRGEASLANVPLVTQNGQSMLEVGMPFGTGMRVETETLPGSADADPNGITGLIAAIKARTNAPDALVDQREMTGVGSGFLDDLPNKGADLVVRTLIPVVGAGVTTPPVEPIKITAPVPSGNTRPVATVIDVRGLPSGTVIQLDNIQFVAVVGEVTMTGGTGSQVATGDSKRQIIVLGEDDDVIRAGGGDDIVGSRGGNDRLYGDDGNDIVIGGAGDDWLEGGAGNDVLQGGGSDAGTWRFSLVDDNLVSNFDAAHVIAAETASAQRVGPWWTEGTHGKETDNRLQFSYDSVDRLKLVSTLYTAVVGEQPEVLDFNHFVGSGLNDLQLANEAINYWFASRIMPQAIEAQVAMLINTLWGEGAASDNLIGLGSQFITGGGSWAEAMLLLARAGEAEQLIRVDSGALKLVQDLVTSETGRNQGNAGNDTLLGGAGNDRLIGGGGNNFLDGGEGTDVAVYTGALADFSFEMRKVDGVTQMVLTTLHTGDVDVLQNIELLKVGGNYFQLDEAIAALPTGRDFSLDGYVIELTAQQVHSLDLAGLY